jgi:hypothetical protein
VVADNNKSPLLNVKWTRLMETSSAPIHIGCPSVTRWRHLRTGYGLVLGCRINRERTLSTTWEMSVVIINA